jgi:hypothetical protein
MRSSSAHSRDFSSARGAVRAFFYAFPQVSIRPPISAGMNDKKPLQIILGSALHAESQSVGLAVAALRKAQGKPNMNDFPVGSPEFEKFEAEFLQDVLAFLGDDPNEADMFDELGI